MSKRIITIDQLTDGMLYLIEPSKVQRAAIEQDLITKSTGFDSKLKELIIVRTFIMAKLLQLMFDHTLSNKILESFHNKLFSSFEEHHGERWTSDFEELMKKRYDEYYSSSKVLDVQNDDPHGAESMGFGTSIACNVMGYDKNNISEYLKVDFFESIKFYIFYVSHYTSESKMFEKYKNDFKIIE